MKVLVLDRDGVINEDSPDYIRSVEEWQPIPGSIEAIARASKAGYTIAVASNQSGLARGLFDLDALTEIHDRMIEAVEDAGGRIDIITWCPHHPDEDCECRKPRIGLLMRIEQELGVSLAGQWFVGDSTRDLEAARAAGMIPVLVRTGNGSKIENDIDRREVRVFDDLGGAVEELLKNA